MVVRVRATVPPRQTRRPSAQRAAIQAKVLRWFDAHARAFPWRQHREPYATMVAEVMLQQTQTGRVGPSYAAFLEHFPTVEHLAHAPAMDVIRMWKGLGYNRRAVDLQRAAQMIVADHGGEFPADPKALKRLPGIGEYSAAAIACFAFDAQVPVIDVNVARVLSRSALGKDAEQVDRTRIADTATAWVPDGDAYRWNQALMDIGAMFCRAEKPLCQQCPLKTSCRYKAAGRNARPAAPRMKQGTFEGSRRQKRGNIIDTLRDAASSGITLAALARAIHPGETERNLGWLVELLDGLEKDGLVRLTPAARRGNPRGSVQLPS